MTILYNLILAALDLAALLLVKRSKSVALWILTLLITGMLALVLAGILARGRFEFFRLAVYAVFLHGTVLWLGSIVVWWRTKKSLAIFSGLISASLLLLVYDVFLIEPFRLEVTYWQITSPKIQRPHRVVVIADLQADQFTDYGAMYYAAQWKKNPI